MNKSELKQLIKEEFNKAIESSEIENAYSEAMENETGIKPNLKDFDWDMVHKKETLTIINAFVDGEEYEEITLVKTTDGKGWQLAF